MPPAPITNALTIDVEDYFQVSAMAPFIDRGRWDDCECRVEPNVERILELLDANQAQATFFTLGWIAERYPQLVRRIVAAGHELASHGHGHQRVSELTAKAFEVDLRRAKAVLEDTGGVPVQGYRAPSFSIDATTPWAAELLADTGHRYSSSIYPVQHDHYGAPDAPRFCYRHGNGLLEIPPTTMRMFERNWPSSGGGFFRLLPYRVSRWMIGKVNREESQPAVFYFHPWEVDPEQPRVAGIDARTRFRHYLNLGRMEPRLRRLLADFRWGRMDRVFLDRQQGAAA